MKKYKVRISIPMEYTVDAVDQIHAYQVAKARAIEELNDGLTDSFVLEPVFAILVAKNFNITK